MKKYFACALITACLFNITACSRMEKSLNIQNIIADKTYTYEEEGFGGNFTIHINNDGTFSYYEGPLSSYIGMGSWTLENDILVLSDDEQMGYPFVNRFKVDGNDLVFVSENSSNFLYIKVADGKRFTGTPGEA